MLPIPSPNAQTDPNPAQKNVESKTTNSSQKPGNPQATSQEEITLQKTKETTQTRLKLVPFSTDPQFPVLKAII
ncbi:MAG: hypothetical protein CAK90_07645 [Spartobacteria bacterium AMD-G4]|nr:MAG: hypothetical protein CAK90_07645 [Spartobacteria bacterium AMD-G4]